MSDRENHIIRKTIRQTKHTERNKHMLYPIVNYEFQQLMTVIESNAPASVFKSVAQSHTSLSDDIPAYANAIIVDLRVKGYQSNTVSYTAYSISDETFV